MCSGKNRSDNRSWYCALVSFDAGDDVTNILPESAEGASGYMAWWVIGDEVPVTILSEELKSAGLKNIEIEEVCEIYEFCEVKEKSEYLFKNLLKFDYNHRFTLGDLYLYGLESLS